MKSNIVLIGMPAVGKSTLGVILAKILGYQFIDSDLVIQNQEQALLKDIIAQKGIEGFIETENRVNQSINCDKSVIATGGSAVYGAQAMEHFKEIAIIVYLKIDYETLNARLNNIKNRGVVIREGQTLKSLYEERSILYEKYADITISEDNHSIEEVLKIILDALSAHEEAEA